MFGSVGCGGVGESSSVARSAAVLYGCSPCTTAATDAVICVSPAAFFHLASSHSAVPCSGLFRVYNFFMFTPLVWFSYTIGHGCCKVKSIFGCSKTVMFLTISTGMCVTMPTVLMWGTSSGKYEPVIVTYPDRQSGYRNPTDMTLAVCGL